MKTISFICLTTLMILSQSIYGQNGCLTNYKSNLDKLLPLELIKEYSKSHELDHYINGKGTDYAESQFFWYPDDETTFSVKLYGIKKETSQSLLERFKRKVQQKSDDIYKYSFADGVGDYAYWTTSNMNLEGATTTDATLTILLGSERFVVQVDFGNYKISQEVAVELANQIITNCK